MLNTSAKLSQQNSFVSVRRTSHEVKLAPPAEQAAWLAKFADQPDTPEQHRVFLARAYLLNHMGPNEFLDCLSEAGLIGSRAQFMEFYAKGVLADG
jgi:hypothetical protein